MRDISLITWAKVSGKSNNLFLGKILVEIDGICYGEDIDDEFEEVLFIFPELFFKAPIKILESVNCIDEKIEPEDSQDWNFEVSDPFFELIACIAGVGGLEKGEKRIGNDKNIINLCPYLGGLDDVADFCDFFVWIFCESIKKKK